MPIYEYRCENGHEFEVFQNMTDDPVAKCEVCGEPVQRVFSPVAVHYKGSGFYTTDYARKGKSTAGGDGAKGGDSKGSDSKGSESGSSEKKKSDSSSTTSKTASKD
jgi:putative FmdB family regulatory protein